MTRKRSARTVCATKRWFMTSRDRRLGSKGPKRNGGTFRSRAELVGGVVRLDYGGDWGIVSLWLVVILITPPASISRERRICHGNVLRCYPPPGFIRHPKDLRNSGQGNPIKTQPKERSLNSTDFGPPFDRAYLRGNTLNAESQNSEVQDISP